MRVLSVMVELARLIMEGIDLASVNGFRKATMTE
jgi:hypothetical protein